MHTMLQVSTTYRGSALGTQGHHVPTAIVKAVGLLLHDVRARADGTNKKAGILEDRGIDAYIAITLANLRCPLLHVSEVSLFRGQDIRCASRCLIQKSPLNWLAYTRAKGVVKGAQESLTRNTNPTPHVKRGYWRHP